MADKPDGRHARMEKYLLRKAFDRPEQPYLPERVLWRQKEQFSDGVGYSWVDGLKAHAAKARMSGKPFVVACDLAKEDVGAKTCPARTCKDKVALMQLRGAVLRMSICNAVPHTTCSGFSAKCTATRAHAYLS